MRNGTELLSVLIIDKLITLEQARKHFNEDLDKWINSITSGAVYHESL